MTLIATIYTPNCIVMGADSLFKLTKDHLSTDIIGISKTQKIYYISKTNTAISIMGRATWEGKTIKSMIQDFSITIDSSFTQQEVAESFNSYIRNMYPHLETSFHLAGYTNNEPYVYDMDYDDGFQLENIGGKYSILARIDDKEIHEKIIPLPDFSEFNIDQSVVFLENLFRYKIEVENKKDCPSVGYPVDYLIITPQEITVKSIRGEQDFII